MLDGGGCIRGKTQSRGEIYIWWVAKKKDHKKEGEASAPSGEADGKRRVFLGA